MIRKLWPHLLLLALGGLADCALGQSILGPATPGEDESKVYTAEFPAPEGGRAFVFWSVPDGLHWQDLGGGRVALDGPPGRYVLRANGIVGTSFDDATQATASLPITILPRVGPEPPEPTPTPEPGPAPPDPEPTEFGPVARVLILYESAELGATAVLSTASVRKALADLVPEDQLGGGLVQEAWRAWDVDLPLPDNSRFLSIFQAAKASGHSQSVFLQDQAGRIEHFPIPATAEELLRKLGEYAR